jgi:molybdopterin molybdotransferase
VFWRVSQKPGKPLYFGKRGKRLVFGLPGNPASAITCFYLYVYPALRRMSGFRNVELPRRSLTARESIVSDDRKWRFLKGKIDGPNLLVDPLPRQGSHMITSLAETDGFIVVPPAAERVDNGEFDTYRLPFLEEE